MVDPPPGDRKAELVATLVKGAIADTIPYVGGTVSEIADALVNPAHRRRQRWMEEVTAAINAIEDRFALLPWDLAKNERFVTLLYHATIVALKNHREEKITGLRNALVSSFDEARYSEDVSLQFVRYVDELSVSHLLMLSALVDRETRVAACKTLDKLFAQVGEASGNPTRLVFRMFLQDLAGRFLIHLGDLADFPEYHTRRSYELRESSTDRPLDVTLLGKSFLSFIRAA